MANGSEPAKNDDPAVGVCFALSVAHDKLRVQHVRGSASRS